MSASTRSGALALALAAVAVATVVPGASAKAHKPFSGKLCPVVTAAELAAAHVGAPCVAKPTRVVGEGPVQERISSATWGVGASAPSWLSVLVQKPAADPELLKEIQAAFRKSVVANGPRVKVGDIGSVSTRTYAGARHQGKLLFIVDGYDIVVDLNDDSPTASRATIKAALVSIGTSIAAKL
jgi:hypothetical protein